jgi:phosphate transport system permease protein
MSSVASTRWTDGSMQKLVAKRYAAERRFRLFGLAAVSLSVAFLAFLLITMAWKGLGGFTATETRVAIDFPRSDLILDPATLRGPQAEEAIASAGLDGVLEQAGIAQFGEGGGELFGDASSRALGEKLISDPDMLTRKVELWLPLS